MPRRKQNKRKRTIVFTRPVIYVSPMLVARIKKHGLNALYVKDLKGL